MIVAATVAVRLWSKAVLLCLPRACSLGGSNEATDSFQEIFNIFQMMFVFNIFQMMLVFNISQSVLESTIFVRFIGTAYGGCTFMFYNSLLPRSPFTGERSA